MTCLQLKQCICLVCHLLTTLLRSDGTPIIFLLKMKKAVFLDRDGVINKERKDYVKSIQEFQILDNIPKTIKMY